MIVSDPNAVNGAIGYTYDNVGNRLQQTSTVTGITAGSFNYDLDDRISTDTYDANGNTLTTAGNPNTNAYDFENHLVQQGSITIVYDGDGNRVSKSVNGVVTKYLVDDGVNPTGYSQVILEDSTANGETQYVYGLELLSERYQGTASSSTYTNAFYGYDGHGSVRFLTDSTGAVTDTYDYDAFGSLLHITGTTPNVYRFAGEQWDPDLNLYYLRARYVNTASGRFLTADTPSDNLSEPRELHLYTYSGDDPVNEVDPGGNQFEDTMVAVAALVTLLTIATVLVLARNLPRSLPRIEIPFRANHYTQWAFVLSILANGLNQPTNYVTTDWYLSAKEAKSKLALSKKPQLLINFLVFVERDSLLGPKPVRPANGEPGGGTEYSSDFPIPVSSREPAIVPLFAN